MNVLLVRPPQAYLVDPDAQMPSGLLYVGATLLEAGHKVQFNKGWLPDDLSRFDLIGFTGTCLDTEDINLSARQAAESGYDGPIVVGGPVSLSPEYLDREVVTTVITGDGEPAILALAADLENNRLKSHYHGQLTDLSSVPRLPRHLWLREVELLGRDIFAYHHQYYPGGSTVMVMNRGCAFQCAFCSSHATRHTVLRRDVEDIIEEMEQVVTDFGVRQFRMADENLTAHIYWLSTFCDAIHSSSILNDGIAWRGSARAVPNNVEVLKLMRSAGCRELSIGIESADQRVLGILNKGVSVSEGLTMLRNCKEADIRTRALLMTGTPGETDYTFSANCQFIGAKEADIISIAMLTPFPGTAIWRTPEKFRCDLLTRDVSKFNLYSFDSDGERDILPFIDLWDFPYSKLATNASNLRRYANKMGILNRG